MDKTIFVILAFAFCGIRSFLSKIAKRKAGKDGTLTKSYCESRILLAKES